MSTFREKEISTPVWALSFCVALVSYAATTSSLAFLVPCAIFLLLASPWVSLIAAAAATTNVFLFSRFPSLGAYPFLAILCIATVALLCMTSLPSAGRNRPQAWMRSLASRGRVWLLCAALAVSALLKASPVFEVLSWASVFFLLGVPLPRPKATGYLSWVNVGVVFVTCVVCAFVLEVGARVLTEPAILAKSKYVRHPLYNFTLLPDREWTDRITLTEGEPFSTQSRSSEQGINGSVVYGPKADDEFRILMLGDSFAAGYGTVWEDTLAQALETLLSGESLPKRCVVINGGIGGYGPWQEHGFLLDRGLSFEPDLVIHQIFAANDVPDTLMQFGRHMDSYPVYWYRQMDNFRRGGLPVFRAHQWVRRHSYVYRLLMRRFPQVTLPRLASHVRFLSVDPVAYPPSLPRNSVMELHLDTWYPTLEDGWEAFEEDVLSIQAECRERGIDYFAFNIPYYVSFRDEVWGPLGEYLEPGLAYEKLKDTIETEAFFEREGIPYVNVSDALGAHPNQSELFHHPDGHLKKQGSWIIAEELQGYLISEYFPGKGLLKTDSSAVRR